MMKVFANKAALAAASLAMGAAGATGYALASGGGSSTTAEPPVVSAHIADAATSSASPTVTDSPTVASTPTVSPAPSDSSAPVASDAPSQPAPSSAPSQTSAPALSASSAPPPPKVVAPPPPHYDCTETHTVVLSANQPVSGQVTWSVGPSDYTVVTGSGAQSGQAAGESGYTAPMTGSWSKTVSVHGCGSVSVHVPSGSCQIVIDGAVAASAGTDAGHVSEGCSAQTPR